MNVLSLRLGLIALVIGNATPISVHAQGLDPGARGQPLDITSDELEVQDKACVSVWRGKAEALQGHARLRADILRAFFRPAPSAPSGKDGSACGELLRIEAEGSVYYVTEDRRVRGNAGLYDATASTVTMTGDVVAVDGQNVLRGERMVFNNETGLGQVIGSPAKPGAIRPRGVFYPSKKSAVTPNP